MWLRLISGFMTDCQFELSSTEEQDKKKVRGLDYEL